MQLENKQQKSIILVLFLYSILSIGCITVFFTFLYPNIAQIEQLKSNTSEVYESVQQAKAQWIWFDLFQAQAGQLAQNPYEQQLVQNIDTLTYNRVFTHTGISPYTTFLADKQSELTQQAVQKWPDQAIVSELLPLYGADWENTEVLSDFAFVNYVESILETFSLQYEGLIGIGNLNLVENFSSTTNKNSLETSIFSIPLDLRITGSKSSVLDFFHYIENSGKISLQEDRIIPYTDNTLSLGWLPIVLEWESYTPDYNIYQNPVVDIVHLSMKEYIDSSVFIREDQAFIDFVKQTRWNEVFDFDITLNFYVKWLPQYKIENKITEVIKDYQKIQSETNQQRKNTNISEGDKINLEKVSDYLQSLQGDIKTLQTNLKKQIRLQDMYTQAKELEQIFNNIREQILDQQK